MKKIISVLCLMFVSFYIAACSTSSHFRIPADTRLTIAGKPVMPRADGVVKVRPFFWSNAGGVHYSLQDQAGNVVREGKLKTSFRISSIIWPPFSIIYWPLKFGNNQYDLTHPADGYYVRDNPKPEPVEQVPVKVRK